MEEDVFVLDAIGFSGHDDGDGVRVVRQGSDMKPPLVWSARIQVREKREKREGGKRSSYGTRVPQNTLKSTISSPAG